jgi:ligand-binding sensor domain-containing protein
MIRGYHISSVAVLVFLFTLFSQNLNSQHNYLFRNYSSDDGLPSSEVHEIIQDKKGYMWFGTDNGLSRFDGYRFKNYGYDEGLKNLVVFGLRLDENDLLWILTMSGNIYIKDELDIITPYKYNHLITAHKDNYFIASAFEFDTLGNIYIALIGNGILTIDTAGNSNNIIPPYEGQIILDTLGISIVSTYNNIKIKRKEIFDKHTSRGLSLPFYWVKGSKVDSFFINSTTQYGYNDIHRFENNLTLFIATGRYRLLKNQSEVKTGPITIKINSHLYMKNGNLWVAWSNGVGITIYPTEDQLLSDKYTSILDGNSITELYQDKDGGVWIGTIENGIYYCPNLEVEVLDKEKRLLSDFVSSIDIVDDSLIYIGMWNKGIQVYNTVSQSFETLYKNKRHYIKDIKYLPKIKDLVISDKLKMLSNPNYEFHNDIYLDHIGCKKISTNIFNNKILGVGYKNYFEFDFDLKKFEHTHKDKYLAVNTNEANYDKNGIRYIGDANGLWIWEENSQIIKPKNLPDILNQRIQAIEFLSDNSIVVGTKGQGIIIWHGEDNYKQISVRDGLISGAIENIYIDSLDNIWVGTLNGLNKISKISGTYYYINTYTKKHGLPGNEITRVRRNGDYIWIATTKGLCKIKDPQSKSMTNIPFITQIVKNGKNINLSDNRSFDYFENNLVIDFVSIEFAAEGDINYRYKIKDDEDWQYTNNTSINYSNLPPDDYSLQIQAQNEDGYWSNSTRYDFVIESAYWNTWWFRLLAIVTLLAAGAYLVYQRISQIQKEVANKDKLLEYERSVLRSQMNPHFIFNVLNSIQSAITQQKEEKSLSLLAKFAKLVRATLNNSRESEISLADEMNYLSSYLDLELVRFPDKFNYKISCDKSIDKHNYMIPPMLIQPLIENALKHGLSSRKDGGGEIKIKIWKQEDYLYVSVQDNGLGLHHNKIRSHKSVALKIIKERLELINKDKKIYENIIFESLTSIEGNTIGTKVTLKVKTS